MTGPLNTLTTHDPTGMSHKYLACSHIIVVKTNSKNCGPETAPVQTDTRIGEEPAIIQIHRKVARMSLDMKCRCLSWTAIVLLSSPVIYESPSLLSAAHENATLTTSNKRADKGKRGSRGSNDFTWVYL